VAGADKNRAGKVLVDMTGGTEGSKEAFEKLSRTEVGTVVCMHLSEEHIKEAEKNHINAVIAGHIASDTIGMNLVLDALERHGALEILETSGFKRVKRG
jgi:putative NIF3 family GTP cyclohydrolase 1 type 2